LTQIIDSTRTLHFLLNRQLKLKEAYKNSTRIAKAKVKSPFNDFYNYQLILAETFKPTDTLTLVVDGNIKKFKQGKKRELRNSQIIIKDSILRAFSDSKWYPIMLDDNNEQVAFTYNLNSTCEDCNNITIGSTVNGTFAANQPTKNLEIIAGKYDIVQNSGISYLNMNPDQITKVEKIVQDVNEYYKVLTGITPTSNLLYAYLPTDVNSNVANGRTLVKTSGDFTQKDLPRFVSNELAKQIVSSLLDDKPSTHDRLDNALATYITLKYLSNAYPESFSITDPYYMPRFNLVNPDTDTEELVLNPYQLIAIEKTLGSDQMMFGFIKNFYDNLNREMNPYLALANGMIQTGAGQDKVRLVENSILQNFNPSSFGIETLATTR